MSNLPEDDTVVPDAAGARSRSPLAVGQTFADYEILDEIKAGGMASLYLARRHGAAGFSQFFAIKVVHEHLAVDPNFLRMFFDEARLSARIDHPNCVHVTDLGHQDGLHYLVMEYVPGFALSEVLGRLAESGLRMSPTAATFVAIQVAKGLHAAHELVDDGGEALGVVHRDVSPQNVLLSDRGYVKVIDFGIAKARDQSANTLSGSLKGKFRYMAPEQARGEAVDRRTDVYALGIVLWEMIAVRRLFNSANDLAVLRQVQNPVIPPPSELAPEVTDELEAVILKALAAEAGERYATMREFQLALQQAAPEALAMDAPELRALLAALMGEEIESRRKKLPPGTAPKLPTPPAASQVVQRHTLRVRRAPTPTEAIPETTPGSGRSVTGPLLAVEENETATIEEPAPAWANERSERRLDQPAIVPPEARGRPRLWLLAIVAGLTGAAGLAYLGLVASNEGGHDAPPADYLEGQAPESVDDPPVVAPVQVSAGDVADMEESESGDPPASDTEAEPPPADPEPRERPAMMRRRVTMEMDVNAEEPTESPSMHPSWEGEVPF